MIKHILDTVSTLQSNIFLVGKPSQKINLQQYGHSWISDHATTFHPLNGIVAGLEHAKDSFAHAFSYLVIHHLCLPILSNCCCNTAHLWLWILPNGSIHC